MEKFKEEAKLLADFITQLTKMYSESNKLHSQNALHTTDDPHVFVISNTFQDYLCTYVHSYENVEIQFDELKKVVNPHIYKNGVLVMSKNHRIRNIKLDSESSEQNYSGPLNSTPNHTAFYDEMEHTECMTELNVDDCSVSVDHCCAINCGSCELVAKDVTMGGAKTFHGILGQFRKSKVDLKDVNRVSSINGRHLASLYIHSLKYLNIQDAPAFIVCCEPKSPMNILSLVLFPDLSNGKNVLHIVSVFNSGDKKSRKVKEESIMLSTYLSTYDILSPDSNDTSYGETSLRIDYHWSGSNFGSMLSPPPSAKQVIQLQVTVGEERSAANEVYIELKRLQMNKSAMSHSSSSYSEQVLEDVRKFKSCVEDIQFYNQESSFNLKTDDIETPMSQLLMESFWNKDIDFTDKLWKFIQESDHLNHIPFILEDVLSDIVNGSLQPAISPNNETKLAKYIRRMYVTSDVETLRDIKEKITDLTSSEQSLVNLVQEIGYEKLRKDYFNFFLSRELTSMSNLEKICKPSIVDITSLWKLHYCLEIIITPTIYLNLTPDCQCILLNSALDYYCSHDIDVMSPLFNLLVLPFHELSSSLLTICKDRKPVLWQHGVLYSNKAGLNEAKVHRIAAKAIVNNSSTDTIEITEEECVFTEETLILPNVKH